MAKPEQIKKEIKKAVSEIVEMPESELRDDASFADELGVDSMMALEIVASIEKKYKVTIPEEEIPNIRSLENVYEVVLKSLNK
ncbi:MAG: acyl carrier protein [Candidatus Omnitrophica bacterium]|nr:acyl carrier protein [Candidatus Omnitrophota bacterium]